MNPPVPAGRRRSPFTPGVNAALIGGALAVLVGSNLWLIAERHAARRVAQAACREQQRAEIQRKPVLVHTVRLADECATVRRMRGEGP